MASTTLMTFLLRTSSNVRSVELLGSWDNFNRVYPMEQDRRVGAGHWRGCHTFTDIICDGSPSSHSPGRSGGLKMGGTYWYYYRLDGDIEYYNDAEPVTSLCPLLPGQPVNILHVPIILPDTNGLHRRDASVSSQKSDQRTMDPMDKYMNPRTPPRPKVPRLRTSPPLHQQAVPAWPFLNLPVNACKTRSISQPASSAHSPKFRLAPKLEVARSVSPPRSRGLRAALMNLAGARSPGADLVEYHRGRPVGHQDGAETTFSQPDSQRDGFSLRVPASNSSSNYGSRVASPMDSPVDGLGIRKLPFRRPMIEREESHPTPSIRSRRASKSSSRDHSPLRSYLILESSSSEDNLSGVSGSSRTRRLETLEEALSQQNTPMPVVITKPLTAIPNLTAPTPLEKRLPTLPNSPSSVMEQELRTMDAQNRPLDVELLHSHFSDYTSGTGTELYPDSPQEKSRFSEWSTDTELVSPVSMTSSSTLTNEQARHSPFTDGSEWSVSSISDFPVSSTGPTTPTLSTGPQLLSPTTAASDPPVLPPITATDTVQISNHDFSITSLCIEDFDEYVENNPKRHAGMFPSLETLTPLTVRPELRSPQSGGLSDSLNVSDGKETGSNRHGDTYPAQSAAMKELMDELGYLGDMIQAGL